MLKCEHHGGVEYEDTGLQRIVVTRSEHLWEGRGGEEGGGGRARKREEDGKGRINLFVLLECS
jgi:hypothetical protein